MKRFWPINALILVATSRAPAQTLTVFAAASLKESFQSIASRFEASHPGVHVQLNFGGSQRLAAQIKLGAPVDVFASAGVEPLKNLSVPESRWRWFAMNKLVIVAPLNNRKLSSLSELSRPIKLVIADVRVPVGDYTETMFRNATKLYGKTWADRVYANVVSREQDVRAVLAKVALGEADAGVVYASDAATASRQVSVVAIPDDLNPIAQYPAVAIGSPSPPHLAVEFVHSLFDAPSQAALKSRGFTSPISPVSMLRIGPRLLSWRDVARLKSCKFKAQDEGQKAQDYSGVDLKLVLSAVHSPIPNQSVTVAAADGYTQTISSSLLANGDVIVCPMGDGNWRLVIRSAKPSLWVRWIRSIDVK